MPDTPFKIGTRGSKLALWQAEWLKTSLENRYPSQSFELVVIKTKGDKILDVPLANVGGKGLFVKEIEDALLTRRVDAAVHSMKDMPADLPPGLCIGIIPERENPGDVLITRSGQGFSELPSGARIGTSSLRRAAQLRHVRPDVTITPLRGNLDTRIKKLDAGKDGLDAIVLAAAGVKRLGFEDRINEYIDFSAMLPAVGQGALCIEIREDDGNIHDMLVPLDHRESNLAVKGERALLKKLEGSCQVPIAAFGMIENDRFIIDGLVADLDGKSMVRDRLSGPCDRAEQIGIALAEKLLSMGADTILSQLNIQK